MRKKYILALVLIGLLFAATLTVGTGYGLYLSTSGSKKTNAATIDCFEVYYSNSDTIELKNISAQVNEDGEKNSPYTLTITNICTETKELQVRFNILDETTINENALTSLTVKVAGNIEQDTILYKNLSDTKTTNEHAISSKLLGKITIEPKETIRTNVKIWFDERKSPEFQKDEIFKGTFELIDTASTIKLSFAEVLLQNNKTIDTANVNYGEASYSADGLVSITTPEGTSYYYRGVVNNNYVRFANNTWRIVGINPDNSIKLILEKSATSMNYSVYNNAIDYTGLKYIYNNETINNNISTYLEQWYQSTIINNNFDNYVVANSYCNDSSNFINSYHTYFNGYTRLITDKHPSIICPTTNADFGGTYKQKVGLLSADEVAIAGGVYGVDNYNYYLYNGETFFTTTPADYYNFVANLFIVTNSGSISTTPTTSIYGVRPVINLTATTTVSGAGTIDNPYTIDME